MSEPPGTRTVTVTNANGMHLVPCSLVAKLARQFAGDVHVHKGDLGVDAKNVLELMTLGAAQGTELRLTATGGDAEAALDRLVELFETGFEVDESPGHSA
jgi:phosphocarrier protein HPr